MEVRINGSIWIEIDLNDKDSSYGNLVFMMNDLENDINVLEIRSKNKSLINIDYFVVDSVIDNTNINSNIFTGTNWFLTFKAIAILLLLAMTVLFVYLLVIKKNNTY